MESVLHVPAFEDNYIWLVRGHRSRHVAIVDPGDETPVIEALNHYQLTPVAVLCTHHHGDHVGGAGELARRYRIPVYGPATEAIGAVTHPLGEGDAPDLSSLGLALTVMEIPGHTRGHIAYYGNGLLFCGDTLFSAGCGRLFEGTPAQMYASLFRLGALPPDTRVYCGHEYTLSNLRFALAVEPENPHIRSQTEIARQQRARGEPTLPSTIERERHINPFLRLDHDSVQRAIQAHDPELTDLSAVNLFAALRRWKDQFQG